MEIEVEVAEDLAILVQEVLVFVVVEIDLERVVEILGQEVRG